MPQNACGTNSVRKQSVLFSGFVIAGIFSYACEYREFVSGILFYSKKLVWTKGFLIILRWNKIKDGNEVTWKLRESHLMVYLIMNYMES